MDSALVVAVRRLQLAVADLDARVRELEEIVYSLPQVRHERRRRLDEPDSSAAQQPRL